MAGYRSSFETITPEYKNGSQKRKKILKFFVKYCYFNKRVVNKMATDITNIITPPNLRRMDRRTVGYMNIYVYLL
jgi:hypothetical protein